MFILDGKTFAYRINTFDLEKKKDESESAVKIPRSVFYVDEDGDGTFEAQYLNNSELPLIPNWVKRNKR